MYNIQKHHRFNQLIAFYKKVGIWSSESDSRFFQTVKKFCNLFISISFFTGVGLGAIQSSNINEFVFLAVICLSDFVVITKLTYIVFKSEEIDAFLQDIVSHSITNDKEYLKIQKKLKNFTNFITFYLWMVFAALIFITILPAFSSETRLPFNVAFPLDWRGSKMSYWITYMCVVFATTIQVIACTFTVIVWYLLVNCSIKYIIIGNQIRDVCFIETKQLVNRKPKVPPTNRSVTKYSILEAEKRGKENLILKKLIGLVQVHLNMEGTMDRFRSCFSNLFFIQIATSGISICGSIFILVFGSHTNLAESSLYVLILLYSIFDIFMIMYFGNQIKLCSNRLSYCLFESNWIDQPQSFKVCMIILSEVFKQPQELVIGKLYPLNMETFTSILNFAYSMFNVLQNFK